MGRLHVIALALIIPLLPTQAHADFMGLLGVNDSIDREVNGLIAVVDRAREAALIVEDKANNHAKERLEQVDATVKDAERQLFVLEHQTYKDTDQLVATVNAKIQERVKQFETLEDKFVHDVNAAIEKAECTTNIVANRDIKDLLGRVGILIGTSTIRIYPPPLYPGERRSICISSDCTVYQDFPIKEPFDTTYREVEKYVADRIDNMTTETPIDSIVVSYNFLRNFAKRAACFTDDAGTYMVLYQRYQLKHDRWALLYKP